MHRFFVSPAVLVRDRVTLTGDQAHQVRRVLRLRPGDRVTLLDGEGIAAEAALAAASDAGAVFEVVRRWPATGEPQVEITLYQAALKGERFAWALQKTTEVGVSRFVPIVCERNVVDDLAAVEAKRERWLRIIQEAAEQSGRGRLPELAAAVVFPKAVEQARATEAGPALIAWEGERTTRLADALAGCNLCARGRIQLFVGPEGGFTDREIELAQERGIVPVSLGARILRAETAGIVAAAAVLYQAGEF